MTAPSLFKEIPLVFFRPLAGKLAPLYWAALQTLYTLDFEGEPFEMTQDTAIEQIALLLEQTPEFLTDPTEFEKALLADEEDASSISAIQTTGAPRPDVESATDSAADSEREARRLARRLLKRLEVCGWFDYEYRQSKKGLTLNFRDYAARVLHTLTQVANQEQPIFEGLAHGIKTTLSTPELEEKPGVAIYNAQTATKDLVREIKILSRNIHRYSDRAIREAKTTKDLLALQLDIYQKKVVDLSYHRFKTSDNIFKYRSFALKQLDFLDQQPILQASAVQWINRNQGVDYTQAQTRLDEWVSLIRTQLSSIHLLTDDLDKKNARYTATTVQKINYLLNQDHLLEGKLVRLLKEAGSLDDQVAWALDPSFACYRLGTFDTSSLYSRPKERAHLEVEEIPLDDTAASKKRKLLEKTRISVKGQHTRQNVYAYAERLLKEKGRVSVADLPWKSPGDLTRAVFLFYHGREARAPFGLELAPEWRSRRVRLGDRYDLRPAELYWKEPDKAPRKDKLL